MQNQERRDLFCQSCGMPLQKPEDFGSAADGSRTHDYCHHCFQEGAFTDPHIDMQGMISKCVTLMAQQGIMPEAQAKAFMTEVIPNLKRWKGK
jgi:hypothetical protein